MWGDLPAAELILNVTDYEANKEGTHHNHSNSEEREGPPGAETANKRCFQRVDFINH